MYLSAIASPSRRIDRDARSTLPASRRGASVSLDLKFEWSHNPENTGPSPLSPGVHRCTVRPKPHAWVGRPRQSSSSSILSARRREGGRQRAGRGRECSFFTRRTSVGSGLHFSKTFFFFFLSRKYGAPPSDRER